MHNSSINFAKIRQETGTKDDAETEELILRCVQSQLIQCRIDQRNKMILVLEVSSSNGRGRDI